jgi:hypothetical protein
MKFHAAILNGPNGPFAVLRTQADQGEDPVSDEQRRAIARCFKDRHDNMPVAFLANEPTGMRLIGYQDASDDLQQCVRDLITSETQWQEFAAPMT